jgi:hypothetical protein
MMKRLGAILSALALAALLALPAVAKEPGGKGLYREHVSTCVSSVFGWTNNTWTGNVTLTGGSGSTFWVDGHHLSIQSYEYMDDGTSDWIVVDHGQKTGQPAPTVVCTGHFGPVGSGYTVRSFDLPVP